MHHSQTWSADVPCTSATSVGSGMMRHAINRVASLWQHTTACGPPTAPCYSCSSGRLRSPCCCTTYTRDNAAHQVLVAIIILPTMPNTHGPCTILCPSLDSVKFGQTQDAPSMTHYTSVSHMLSTRHALSCYAHLPMPVYPKATVCPDLHFAFAFRQYNPTTVTLQSQNACAAVMSNAA